MRLLDEATADRNLSTKDWQNAWLMRKFMQQIEDHHTVEAAATFGAICSTNPEHEKVSMARLTLFDAYPEWTNKARSYGVFDQFNDARLRRKMLALA